MNAPLPRNTILLGAPRCRRPKVEHLRTRDERVFQPIKDDSPARGTRLLFRDGVYFVMERNFMAQTQLQLISPFLR
jgi:hypothetical protein